MLRIAKVAVYAGVAAALLFGTASTALAVETTSVSAVEDDGLQESTEYIVIANGKSADGTLATQSLFAIGEDYSDVPFSAWLVKGNPGPNGFDGGEEPVDVSWSSSDPSVLDIDAKTGVVTPKKSGSVSITATAENGMTQSTIVDSLTYQECVDLTVWFDATKQIDDKWCFSDGVEAIGDPAAFDENGNVAFVDVNKIVCNLQDDRVVNGYNCVQGMRILNIMHSELSDVIGAPVFSVSSDNDAVVQAEVNLLMPVLIFKSAGTANVTITASYTINGEEYSTSRVISVIATGEKECLEPDYDAGNIEFPPSAIVDPATGTEILAVPDDGEILSVEATDTLASNVQVSAGEKVLGSFEVLGRDVSGLRLLFRVGAEYAGLPAKVYVQHGDGSTEVIEATVNQNGAVLIQVDGLSIFTIVVDTDGDSSNAEDPKGDPDTPDENPAENPVEKPVSDSKSEGKTDSKKDGKKNAKKDELPQTGDIASIAIAATALVGSGAVALGMRKRRR